MEKGIRALETSTTSGRGKAAATGKGDTKASTASCNTYIHKYIHICKQTIHDIIYENKNEHMFSISIHIYIHTYIHTYMSGKIEYYASILLAQTFLIIEESTLSPISSVNEANFFGWL